MRVLEATEVGAWTREVLLDPRREKAVVAISTRPGLGGTWLEPKELVAALGDLAEVVCLETGEPTRELASALPPRLAVYGGAVRVWWPGLREDSNPYDHRLFFIQSPGQARAVFDEIVAKVQGSAEKLPHEIHEPVEATVLSISGTRVELGGGDYHGELRAADIPLPELVRCLEVDMKLRVRPLREAADGRWEFSSSGLLWSPWVIAEHSFEVDAVVTGRIQSIREFGAFVDVLPRVTGLVHKSELDWEFVKSVASFVSPGQIVAVKILAIDCEEQKLELSMKRAFGTDPNPLPSLVPGGIPFSWRSDEAPEAPCESAEDLEEKVASLTSERDAMVLDHAQLTEANIQFREQVQEQKKRMRSAEDRFVALEQSLAPELEPLASERGFLLGVRMSYARLFDEGARQDNPLRKMRVGASFLESCRKLDGIDIQKVLEVCAQVAADAAHELASREVHQLREGSRGAGTRVRTRDQAQAWRCSLQVKTASARRLHWWSIPGENGSTIEFANVCVHDEFSIPE